MKIKEWRVRWKVWVGNEQQTRSARFAYGWAAENFLQNMMLHHEVHDPCIDEIPE